MKIFPHRTNKYFVWKRLQNQSKRKKFQNTKTCLKFNLNTRCLFFPKLILLVMHLVFILFKCTFYVNVKIEQINKLSLQIF